MMTYVGTMEASSSNGFICHEEICVTLPLEIVEVLLHSYHWAYCNNSNMG